MNLQLLRGRDLRPPSRSERIKPAAISEAPSDNKIASTLQAPVRKKALRFPVNSATRAFYRRFYPDTTTAEWNDWRWEMRNRIPTLAELGRAFTLSPDERQAGAGATGALSGRTSPCFT